MYIYIHIIYNIIISSFIKIIIFVLVDNNQGVNFTALRELKFLRYIKSPNIIEVRKISIITDDIYCMYIHYFYSNTIIYILYII